MSLFPWDFRQASILRRFFENTQGRLRGSSSGRGRCRRGLRRESQGRFQEAGLSAFFREPRTVVAYSRMVHPRLAAPALCVGIAAFPRVQPRCGSVHRRDRLAAAVRADPRIGVTVLRIARPRGSVSTVRWKICSSSIQCALCINQSAADGCRSGGGTHFRRVNAKIWSLPIF